MGEERGGKERGRKGRGVKEGKQRVVREMFVGYRGKDKNWREKNIIYDVICITGIVIGVYIQYISAERVGTAKEKARSSTET